MDVGRRMVLEKKLHQQPSSKEEEEEEGRRREGLVHTPRPPHYWRGRRRAEGCSIKSALNENCKSVLIENHNFWVIFNKNQFGALHVVFEDFDRTKTF